MKKIAIILLVNLWNSISAQVWIPPQYGNVPKDVYKANVIYLRVKSYEDLGKEDLWNFANAYINLKCSPDTVYKYTQLGLKTGIHNMCLLYTSFNSRSKEKINEHYGDLYANSLNLIKNTCDSLKETYNYVFIKNLTDLANQDNREQQLLDKANVGTQIGEIATKEMGVKRYLNCSLRVHKLDSLIGIFGFPTSSLVGYTNVPKAINIILHGPLEYMEKVLPIAQKAYDEGNFDGYELAHLIDRILMLSGKKQVYGTQFYFIEDKIYLFPVEDPKNLEKRRKKMDIPTVKSLQHYYKNKPKGER
ncbi:MAG TPA: hypothetical protein PLH86_07845 [Saprospiraceae bacterium]|nr:hypothetical protein [Saprospiraceae bacterium]